MNSLLTSWNHNVGNNSIKNLLSQLNTVLATINDEKTFNEDKLINDVATGRELINSLSEKLSH